MRSFCLIAMLSLLLLASMAHALPQKLDADGGPAFKGNLNVSAKRYIVFFNENFSMPNSGWRIADALGGQPERAYPGLNSVAIPAYAKSPRGQGFDRISPGIFRSLFPGSIREIREELVMRELLAETGPIVGAPGAWSSGYNGTGARVCIVDTGIDYSSTQLPTNFVAKDFTTDDWCIDAPGKATGWVHKYMLNVSANRTWREFGLWWADGSNRYDISVYYPNGSLARTSAGSAMLSNSYGYFTKVNATTTSIMGVYRVEVNYTGVLNSGDYPTLFWGANVTSMPQYYTSSGCVATPNPVTAGDTRAFYNIHPHDDGGSSHGTHVAGIIAKQSEPKGIAPGATLYIAKALASSGSGWETDISNAVQWCIDNNADVVSMSLGADSGACNSLSASMIGNSGSYSPLFVVAAGNSGGVVNDPGCAKNALTVGAVYKNGSLAPFSCRDGYADRLKPEIVAPGVYINSTVVPNSTGVLSGTSMATPVVSGLAAILYQKFPNVDPGAAKAMIVASGDLADCNQDYGCGIPNATKMLSFDFKTGEIFNYRKMMTFSTGNRNGLDMLLYWREPAASHSQITLGVEKSDGSVLAGSGHTDRAVEKVGIPSAAPGENWNATLYPVGAAQTVRYFLVFPANYTVVSEFSNKTIRKGYVETITVTVKNNNPAISLYLSGLAIEAWNASGLIAQFHIDGNEPLFAIDPLSTKVFTYDIYIPKNMPEGSYLKVRAFRRITPYETRLYWTYGLEGDAVNETAAREPGYGDPDWLPYNYYYVDFPSISRLTLPGSSHGLVVEPFPPYNLYCSFYGNGTHLTENEMLWNGSSLRYSSCPNTADVTERENTPFEAFEVVSYPIVEPDRPPFEITVSNNTLRRKYFELVNVSITNNQESALYFDFMLFELYNITSGDRVATLWSWPAPYINPISSVNLSFTVYVPDTVPVGPDLRLRLLAQRVQDYNMSMVSLASNIGTADALSVNYDDSKWPVQWPKFSTWERRRLWADNETTRFEFSLYHSFSFCDYCSPRGELTLYHIFNNTQKLQFYHPGTTQCCCPTCACPFYVDAEWSELKLHYLNEGPNLLALYVNYDCTRAGRSDESRKPAYPMIMVTRQYFHVVRYGGGITDSPVPPLVVGFEKAGNWTLRRGYYENITVGITNNNPVAVSLNSLLIQLVNPDRKVPILLDGGNYQESIPVGATRNYSYPVYIPANVISGTLGAEATFSYVMDEGWRRNAPNETDLMKRFGYNDLNWSISRFSMGKFHRKRFFLPSYMKAFEFTARGMGSLWSTWNSSSTVTTLFTPTTGNDYFWQTVKGSFFNTQTENLLSFVASSVATGKEGVGIRVYFNQSVSIPVNMSKPDADAVKGAYNVNETIYENTTYPVALQYANNLEWPVYVQTMVALQDKVLQRNEYLVGDTMPLGANSSPPGAIRNVFVPGARRYFNGYASLQGGTTTPLFGCDGSRSAALASNSTVTFRTAAINTSNVGYLIFVFKGGQTVSNLSAQWYMNGKPILTQGAVNGAGSWSSGGFTLTFMPCERFALGDGTQYVYGTYLLFAPISNSKNVTFTNGAQQTIAVSAASGGFVAVETSTSACEATYDFCGQRMTSTPNMVLVPVPFRFASELNERHYWKRAYASFAQAANPSYDASYWPVGGIERILSRNQDSYVSPPYTFRTDLYVHPSTKEIRVPRTSDLFINGQNVSSLTSVYQQVNLGDVNTFAFYTTSSSPYAAFVIDYLVPTYKEPVLIYDFTLEPLSQTFRMVSGDSIAKIFMINNTGNRALNISLYTNDTAAVPNVSSVRLGPGESANISLTIASAGLLLGTHTSTLTAYNADAGTRAAILSFVVESEADYGFTLAPASSTFSLFEGESASEFYALSNTGNKPLNITVSANASWAQPDPSDFQLSPGDRADFTTLFATSSLPVGNYSARITADGGLAGARSARVSISISPVIPGGGNYTPINVTNSLVLWADNFSVCYPAYEQFHVTDYVHEYPVQSALIRVYSSLTGILVGTLSTDDDGYAAAPFPPDTYYARASKSSYDISQVIYFSVRNCTANITQPNATQPNITPANFTNFTNITPPLPPVYQNVNITAPTEVEVGSVVGVLVTFENGTPLSGGIVEVTDPNNRSMTFVLDANGRAQYTASTEGFYRYGVFGYNVIRTVITYAYAPARPPEMKTLIIPFYITEPNKVQLEVLSLGNPQVANVRIEGPMRMQNTTNSIGLFTADITQPGSYVIVVTAQNVKSLSAQLTLNRLPFQRSLLEESIIALIILILIALAVAYAFRKTALGFLAKGKFANVRFTPEQPKKKQPVEIAFSSDGKPIAGAKATILSEKGDAYTYTTREDGTILFLPVDPGVYRIAIKGYTIFGSDELEVR